MGRELYLLLLLLSSVHEPTYLLLAFHKKGEERSRKKKFILYTDKEVRKRGVTTTLQFLVLKYRWP